jgi:hypothetical protein
VDLSLDASPQTYRARRFDPRTGEFEELGVQRDISVFAYQPPDEQDWVVLLQRVRQPLSPEEQKTS